MVRLPALSYGAFVQAVYTGKPNLEHSRKDSLVYSFRTDLFKAEFDQQCVTREQHHGHQAAGQAFISSSKTKKNTPVEILLAMPHKWTPAKWALVEAKLKEKHFKVSNFNLTSGMPSEESVPQQSQFVAGNLFKKQFMLVG